MDGRKGRLRESIKITYTNAQSLIKKIDELRVIAAHRRPDVVTITETWTNDAIGNNYLQIDGYSI